MPPYKSPSTSPGFPCTIWSNNVPPAPLAEFVYFELFNYSLSPEQPVVTNNPSTLIISFGIIPKWIFHFWNSFSYYYFEHILSTFIDFFRLMDVSRITFCSMVGDIICFYNFRRLWSLQKCPAKFKGPFKCLYNVLQNHLSDNHLLSAQLRSPCDSEGYKCI